MTSFYALHASEYIQALKTAHVQQFVPNNLNFVMINKTSHGMRHHYHVLHISIKLSKYSQFFLQVAYTIFPLV